MAADESSAPSRSGRGASPRRDSGTRVSAPTIASSTTGTLTRNTEPHQKCSTSRPPSTGPAETPSAETPPHTAIARGRSSASKTCITMARVAGISRAPPTPMTPRATMSEEADAVERGSDRTGTEHGEPREQRAASPVPVSDAPGREEQAREHQGVGVHHPLHLGSREAETSDEGGDGDIEHRVVEGDHEQAQAQDGEDRPPAGDDVAAQSSSASRSVGSSHAGHRASVISSTRGARRTGAAHASVLASVARAHRPGRRGVAGPSADGRPGRMT